MFSLLQVMSAALVAFLMGTVSASPARAEEQVRTLRVSTFKGQPYYVAAYFLAKVAPPNIKIDIVETATSSEALDAVLTGDTDAAYLGLITCVLGVARDRPIAAVASVGRKGTRIVARADSGITSVKDLAGKNIGVSKSTNQDLILRELMAAAGLDPQKDANFILLPTNAHIEAIVTKTVDAVSTSEPYGSFLLAKGIARDLAPDLYKTPVGEVGNVLALRKETIEKDPEFAQKIVDLHAKATAYARTHPDEVAEELVKVSRQPKDIIMMALSNTELTYDIDATYLSHAGVIMDRLINAKYLNRKVDAEAVFDLRFLPHARSFAGPLQ
jgi:NitT/TauT family transport system substrate-binding protein